MDQLDRFFAELVRLAPYAAFFLSLAVVTKGRALLGDLRRDVSQHRTTLGFFLIDILFVSPIAASIALWPVQSLHLGRGATDFWTGLSPWLTLPAVLLIGDYVGYWRHRLSHTPLLWPLHLAHHSDRALNWTSLFRVHPLERFYTATVDSVILALWGFPFWAIVANNFVRSSWGFFVHADLPWTFGKLGSIIVTPSMHRWHHVIDEELSGRNFANLFTFWDRIHGTYHHSEQPCTEPTGVDGHEVGFIREMIFPVHAFFAPFLAVPRGLLNMRARKS